MRSIIFFSIHLSLEPLKNIYVNDVLKKYAVRLIDSPSLTDVLQSLGHRCQERKQRYFTDNSMEGAYVIDVFSIDTQREDYETSA